MKIAHIVNPVIVPETSDLFAAQPITFESMRTARAFAEPEVRVDLWSAQYPEDRALVPADFKTTPDLTRSVLDLQSFRRPKKYPLIIDILDRLYEAAPDADVLIYTNVDIGLVPHFYTAVASMIEAGRDGVVINKRLVSRDYKRPDDLPFIMAEHGLSHPGFDCFVFKRSLYPSFNLGNVCVGVYSFGWTPHLNLRCLARGFEVLGDRHLTFHIGDDRVWMNPDYSDYARHNKRENYEIWFDFRKRGLLKTADRDQPSGKPWTQKISDAVTRLLQKRFPRDAAPPAVKVRANDTFIISYPRSGNTWVRFLIAHLLTRQKINFRNIDRFVPDLHKSTSGIEALRGPRFMKSHLASFKFCPKTIYVCRDGRDAVASYFHYRVGQRSFEGNFSEFLRKDARETFGSWSRHVAAALQFQKAHPDRMLWVRYEDLLMHPLREIRRIASFCSLSVSDADLDRAVKSCNFDEMKRSEKIHGPDNPKSPTIFFREGKTGGWKSVFSEEDIRYFHAEAGAVLAQAGYET